MEVISGSSQLRRTLVVEGPLALRMRRFEAAQRGDVGLQILTLPQLAARLAGGFLRPAMRQDIAPAAQLALADGRLAELGPISNLPGMVRALANTLNRLWLANTDLATAETSARITDLAILDRRVRTRLGPGVLAPPDPIEAALGQLNLAQVRLGPVTFAANLAVPPVLRGLLEGLGRSVQVVYEPARKWAESQIPATVVCADPASEVVEALRWSRQLIVTGQAQPREIAIVAAAPRAWDEMIVALARAADLPLHASHGLPALATRDGQACAALADLLTYGLSQDRIRRLLSYGADAPALRDLPAAPLSGLEREARLRSLDDWRRALAEATSRRNDSVDVASAMSPILELLVQGPAEASTAGARLLGPPAGRIWRAALQFSPPQALGFALESLRLADERDPASSIVWGPAGHLVGAPRPWVRMLGLTAHGWPQPPDSDPLLPDHILSLPELTSRSERDRQNFIAISAEATGGLILSYARRSGEGGLQARSTLIPHTVTPTVLGAVRIPEHAFSEGDRLRARPTDALQDERVRTANDGWRARRQSGVSGLDGRLRPNHPALVRRLAEPQSATSLRQIIRDPLGYLWRYVLGWRDAVHVDLPLSLDDRAFGDLVHLLLQRTVSSLEPSPGFGRATREEVENALAAAAEAVLHSWPLRRAAPPTLLWRHTLDLGRRLAFSALNLDEPFVAGTRSWTELAFGDAGRALDSTAPWDPREEIVFPGTALRVRGVIDRLELDGAGARARVTDYKTGTPPRQPDRIMLEGGRELQRVLYAAAVRHHHPDVRILARLIYLREEPPNPNRRLSAEALDAALSAGAAAFNVASRVVLEGVTLPGPDAEETWNPFRLALPARGEPYLRVKRAGFSQAFGDLNRVWRTP